MSSSASDSDVETKSSRRIDRHLGRPLNKDVVQQLRSMLQQRDEEKDGLMEELNKLRVELQEEKRERMKVESILNKKELEVVNLLKELKESKKQHHLVTTVILNEDREINCETPGGFIHSSLKFMEELEQRIHTYKEGIKNNYLVDKADKN